MAKIKIPNFEPYTSLAITSLKEIDAIFEKILSTDFKFKPKKIDKPIILYGAGNLGKMAKSFFDYFNIPLLYVVDKNAGQYKTDEFWKNTKIIHPDDIEKIDKKKCLLVICILTTPLIALRDELENNGWKDVAFFYDISEAYCKKHPLSNGWFIGKIKGGNKKLIKKTYYALADDVSRAYYIQFIAWRKLRIELLFDSLKINLDDRFFIPEVTDVLKENEVFVDCGAHYGLVTEKFLKIVGNRSKMIYAIEPDKSNFKILEDHLENIKNIKILKYALSNKNKKEENFFQGFNYVSKLNKRGNSSVKTITLDSLKIPATFVKIHLEGGELNSLKGAVKTIWKFRPIIVTTLYHSQDGIWRIPLFIINNTKNYKYHIRMHSWGGTGAVLYAVPKERNNKQ